ncbi:MAG: hypothetical protein Q7S89_03305 [bacterium]|nr:hypothetical protein [bacterium]
MNPPENPEERLNALLRRLEDVDRVKDEPIIGIARKAQSPRQALKEARGEKWDEKVAMRCWFLAVLKRDYEWKFIELYGDDTAPQ